jgi:hypothetical protein
MRLLATCPLSGSQVEDELTSDKSIENRAGCAACIVSEALVVGELKSCCCWLSFSSCHALCCVSVTALPPL